MNEQLPEFFRPHTHQFWMSTAQQGQIVTICTKCGYNPDEPDSVPPMPTFTQEELQEAQEYLLKQIRECQKAQGMFN